MSQSIMNDVVQSVAAAVAARFPDLPVYTEPGPEGFPAPCFFVHLLKSEQHQELGRRFKRTYSLDVGFYPALERSRESAYEVAEQLYELFADFPADDGLSHGEGISAEIKDDGTLHLYLTFRQWVWSSAREEIKMRKLQQEGKVKDGV
ncbi:phage tail terminator family protein [Paenibacillus sp. TH7-28]